MNINTELDRDITIKMEIFARDSAKNVYRLFFHSNMDIGHKSNTFLGFADRLYKGDTIRDGVKLALREDLGIKKIKQIKIVGSDVNVIDLDDTVIKTLTESLDDERTIVIEVEYEPDLDTHLGNHLFVTWLEIEDNKD